MRKLKLGELDVRMTGGSDGEGGGAGPVVVLLHGFGAPATDLVPLWRQLRVPQDTRFVFPAAPIVLEPGMPDEYAGRAFWMIDIVELQTMAARGKVAELIERTPQGIGEARKALASVLDALESELSVPSSRVILGGFSQGAMLACDFALRDQRPLAGLVALSGTVITLSEWTALAPKRRGLPFFQSHGRADPILPFQLALALGELLRGAGLRQHWVEFNGGHAIPPSVLHGLGEFVSQVFSE